MLKTLKKSKKKKDIDEHLIYILKNTTPYQRLVWLKRALNFWKKLKTERRAKGFNLIGEKVSSISGKK